MIAELARPNDVTEIRDGLSLGQDGKAMPARVFVSTLDGAWLHPSSPLEGISLPTTS